MADGTPTTPLVTGAADTVGGGLGRGDGERRAGQRADRGGAGGRGTGAYGEDQAEQGGEPDDPDGDRAAVGEIGGGQQ